MVECLPYIIWKRAPNKNIIGGFDKPYVFARCSNSRTAIELIDIALRENPRARLWKEYDKTVL